MERAKSSPNRPGDDLLALPLPVVEEQVPELREIPRLEIETLPSEYLLNRMSNASKTSAYHPERREEILRRVFFDVRSRRATKKIDATISVAPLL